MSNTVGHSLVRTDLETDLLDRLSAKVPSELIEVAPPLRLDEIAQPTDRSTTIQVKTLMEFYDLFRKVMDAARILPGCYIQRTGY